MFMSGLPFFTFCRTCITMTQFAPWSPVVWTINIFALFVLTQNDVPITSKMALFANSPLITNVQMKHLHFKGNFTHTRQFPLSATDFCSLTAEWEKTPDHRVVGKSILIIIYNNFVFLLTKQRWTGTFFLCLSHSGCLFNYIITHLLSHTNNKNSISVEVSCS